MIYVSCEFETSIGRLDLSNYVRALRLDLFGRDAGGEGILLGKIAADQVLIGEAQNHGMSLFDVCDQDSQGLYETYVALFDDRGEFQPELAIDLPVDSLVFLWRSVVHPRLRPYLSGVIETIGMLFGADTVVAMWHRTIGLADSELAALGFRRIAGSDLIYRHSALTSDFSKEYPEGIEVPFDFEPEPSDGNWVLQEWKKGQRPVSDDDG